MESTTKPIQYMSEVLYVGMCDIIGTPTQVKIRRDVMDTAEMMRQPVELHIGFKMMESGSRREGFRLLTSDVDLMYWRPYDLLICDLSQIPHNHPSTQTVILIECHNSPPGSAKLRLLTPTSTQEIRQSCVNVNGQVYISSCLYRKVTQILKQRNPVYQPAKLHGPCTRGRIYILDFDFANCFSSAQWPLPAYQWIDRCQRQRWPSSQVLQNIISGGCHFVAIGSGQSTSPQQNETEWRLSFSRAEYKLVHSMNHTQFLCYGVLKLFLRDVLNVGFEDPLLCSYFLKTALFWKIQENKISVWCSKNLLHCVWVCFKYLTHGVYRGEFPNFFIPQNNMFINKIHGAAQQKLFQQLLTLYDMGFSCLLLSPSLCKILTKAKLYSQLHVSTDENNIKTEVELDKELFREFLSCMGFFISYITDDIFVTFTNAITTDTLHKTIPSYSQIHIVTLHVVKNISLVRTVFYLDKSGKDNDMHSADNNRLLDMLISATESGFISDTLYVAMYLYNKNKYTEALHYTERTKQKLSKPYVFNINTDNVNKERYIEAVGGQSLLDKVRKAVSFDIIIDQICCIEEVTLEVRVSKQNGIPSIYVPSLVMIHMLLFLCHYRLGDRLRSRQSLDKLQNLLHCDRGQYIPLFGKDISWQILGICQQIYGDKERALYSYQQSLIQIDCNKINTASWTRMQSMLF